EAAEDLGRVLPQAGRQARDRRRRLDHRVSGVTPSQRWFVLSIFVLSSTINYLDRQTLATVAPVLRGELPLPNEEYGWIVAAFSITYAICAPLAGLLIDRIGLHRGIS